MSRPICPICGTSMTKYGKTAAGRQRWRCAGCNSTSTHKIDSAAKALAAFLDWLFSSKRQKDMPGEGRTFRRKCARFWKVWPLPPVTGEVHRVIFVDGIYLARNVVILIAATDKHVIGWYVARSECSRSWKALLSKIAPPDLVVTDGGTGFEKARREVWPGTRVQRCLFHVFCQVRNQTTTRPKLQAGVELYGLAKGLLHISDPGAATRWLIAFNGWCNDWEEFLAERTINPDTGKWDWTHERLVTARNSLLNLVKKDILFTFLDPELTAEGPLPSMNNRIEGGVNAQLRDTLRKHRGLSTMRRVKAAFWWCYMHTECPLPPAEILETMPTDDDIEEVYRQSVYEPQKGYGPQEWGDGLVWAELRRALPWRVEWD